jgi:hypothetical protein
MSRSVHHSLKPAYVRRQSKFGVIDVRPDGYVRGLDDFPTPPWATRAFFKYVSTIKFARGMRLGFIDPACGRGHMVRTVRERGFRCTASDVHDYGMPGAAVWDYCDRGVPLPAYDVMITNPPFKLAAEFAERALDEARVGVAMLVRTLWAEGGRGGKRSRYARIFEERPPTRIAIFSARMPARAGVVIQHYPVFMSHSWFWWNKMQPLGRTEFTWIPPEAQSELEREEDYA